MKLKLGHTLKHEDLVWAVACTNEGNEVASGSADGTVRVWDVDTGELKATIFPFDNKDIITDHSLGAGEVFAVAFSPDGRLIAIGGNDDDGVDVWNWRTGAIVRTLSHDDAVISLSSNSTEYLASADRACLARVWRWSSGELCATLVHPGLVAVALQNLNSPHLASCSSDGSVNVWNWKKGEAMITLYHTGALRALAFHPVDHRRIVCGSEDGYMTFWNWRDGTEVSRRLFGGGNSVTALAFSPDGAVLAAGGSYEEIGEIRTYGLGGLGTQQSRVANRRGGVDLAFGKGGKVLGSACFDKTAKVWHAVETKPSEKQRSRPPKPEKSHSLSKRLVSQCATEESPASRKRQKVVVLENGAGVVAKRPPGQPSRPPSAARERSSIRSPALSSPPVGAALDAAPTAAAYPTQAEDARVTRSRAAWIDGQGPPTQSASAEAARSDASRRMRDCPPPRVYIGEILTSADAAEEEERIALLEQKREHLEKLRDLERDEMLAEVDERCAALEQSYWKELSEISTELTESREALQKYRLSSQRIGSSTAASSEDGAVVQLSDGPDAKAVAVRTWNSLQTDLRRIREQLRQVGQEMEQRELMRRKAEQADVRLRRMHSWLESDERRTEYKKRALKQAFKASPELFDENE